MRPLAALFLLLGLAGCDKILSAICPDDSPGYECVEVSLPIPVIPARDEMP